MANNLWLHELCPMRTYVSCRHETELNWQHLSSTQSLCTGASLLWREPKHDSAKFSLTRQLSGKTKHARWHRHYKKWPNHAQIRFVSPGPLINLSKHDILLQTGRWGGRDHFHSQWQSSFPDEVWCWWHEEAYHTAYTFGRVRSKHCFERRRRHNGKLDKLHVITNVSMSCPQSRCLWRSMEATWTRHRSQS